MSIDPGAPEKSVPFLDATVAHSPGETTHHALLACQSQHMELKCCKKCDNENRRTETEETLTSSQQVMHSTDNCTIPNYYEILFRNIIQNLTKDSEALLNNGSAQNPELDSSSKQVSPKIETGYSEASVIHSLSRIFHPETEAGTSEASITPGPGNLSFPKLSSAPYPEELGSLFPLLQLNIKFGSSEAIPISEPENIRSPGFPPQTVLTCPFQAETVQTNYNSSIDHLAEINNILCELFCHQQSAAIMDKSPRQDGFLEIFNYASGIFPSFTMNAGSDLPSSSSATSSTYSIPDISTQLSLALLSNFCSPAGSRQDPTVTQPVTVICPQPLPQGTIPKFLKEDVDHYSESNNRLKDLIQLPNFKRQKLFSKLMSSTKRKECPRKTVLRKRRKRVKTVSTGDSAPQQVSVDTSLPIRRFSPIQEDSQICQPLANHQQNKITAVTVRNKLAFVAPEAKDRTPPPMSPTSPELTTLLPLKKPIKKASKPRKMAKNGKVKDTKERTPSSDEEEEEVSHLDSQIYWITVVAARLSNSLSP